MIFVTIPDRGRASVFSGNSRLPPSSSSPHKTPFRALGLFPSLPPPAPPPPLLPIDRRRGSMRPSFSSVPDVVKNRWLGFLIWQYITATSVYLLVSPFIGPSSTSFFASLLPFLIFHLSLLLFSFSLFLTSSPYPEPSASLTELGGGLFRSFIKSLVGGFQGPSFHVEFRRRVGRTMRSLALVAICTASGLLSVVAVCGDLEGLYCSALVYVGLRGLIFGLVYGSYYVYMKRWALQFPIVQVSLEFVLPIINWRKGI